MIDKLTVSQIKNTAKIEEIIGDFIDLKKAGVNYKAPCPFHDEKTGSFIVSPAKGIYKCFGCGASGDSINFIMEHKGRSYPEALKYIADKYNILIDEHIPRSIKTEKSKEIQRNEKIRKQREADEAKAKEKALNFLIQNALKNKKDKAAEYLENRGIDTISLPDNAFFQLEKYKEHPGGVVFLSSERKYLNKRNFITPKDGAKQFTYGTLTNSVYDITFLDKDTVFVTEGVINAMSIYQVGKSAIALFATTNQINNIPKFEKYFDKKNVVIAFDFDKNGAGQRAALKLLSTIQKNFNVNDISILLHPEGKDDNDLLKENKLAEWLNNPFNYIYPTKKELNIQLKAIQADYNYIPKLQVSNYYTRKAATAEEDGKFTKITDTIPDEIFDKLNVSGELTKIVLDDANFKYVTEYTVINNRTAHVYSSTPDNPIFTIDAKIIIRPFATKPYKKFEFYEQYTKDFNIGVNLVESAFMTSADDAGSVEDLKNNQKLKRVILTYNVIDFLNLLAIGENPVYIHEDIDYDLKEKLLGFAFSIYQCPTNNFSDKKRARIIASKNIEIKTYYLEKQYHSVSHFIREKSDNYFKKHLNTALPFKFWEWDKKTKDFDLNVVILQNFLNGFGYYTHESIQDKQGYMYIKTEGKVVKKMDKDVFPRQIKIFVDKYLSKRGENVKLRNKIMVTNRFSENNLSNLKQVELDFNNSGPNFQNFFFDDGNMWTVTKNGIKLSSQNELKKYVWEEELLKYPSKVQEAPFKIFYKEKYAKALKNKQLAKSPAERKKYAKQLSEFKHIDKYDIEIIDRENYYLQYLFATSFVYFEKAESNDFFVKPNQFWYEFPKDMFSEDEISEIKLHVINKITWLGYYMKDYREPADDFGLAILDAIDDLPGGNRKRGAAGGGKSLITKGLREVKRTLILKAEGEDFAEDKHRYANYENEKIIVCDDMHLKSRIGNMLTDFSEGINVNPKHKKVISIPFERSPKLIVTRNYIDDEGERVDRRLGRMFVFPFFHDNKSGRFKQRRKPQDWFGRMLYKDDTKQDKSNLINFFAYAYIANRTFGEINPPMQDMEKFRLSKRIGEPLIEFLSLYFDDTENFGYIDRVPFYKQFIEEQRFNMNNWQKTQVYNTSQKFKHLVADYCKIQGWVFNPAELYTDDKRIRMKSETQVNKNGYAKMTEHFFVHTVEGANEEIENKANTVEKTEIKQEITQMEIPEFPDQTGDKTPF